MARDAGYTDRREYRYYNKETKGLDLNGMLEDLQVSLNKMLNFLSENKACFVYSLYIFKNAPEGSVIILHGCAHNPTGVDPSNEEWIKIADVIKVLN